jgi:nucleotide-binding universal stress UspA family protein
MLGLPEAEGRHPMSSSYRTIVLELRDEPEAEAEARGRTAFALARRFGAEVVTVHVAPLPVVPPSFAAAYVDSGAIEAQRAANARTQDRVRAAWARRREPDLPTRELFLEDDDGAALSRVARAADLTILGPAWREGLGAQAAQPVDDVLVQAGGPVLVHPSGGTAAALPAAKALVAWDGSRQAARAAKDALPLLVLAEEVVVLALGGGDAGGPETAVAMLGRHGVHARAERRPTEDAAGEQLLAASASLGAGLLVMGAYGHSRLRELVLGGATREVLRRADLPVLFSC